MAKLRWPWQPTLDEDPVIAGIQTRLERTETLLGAGNHTEALSESLDVVEFATEQLGSEHEQTKKARIGLEDLLATLRDEEVFGLRTVGIEDRTQRLVTATPGCFGTLQTFRAINAVRFSFHDKEILASASQDNAVRLWRWKTGMCCTILRGHHLEVTAVAFSPRVPDVLASGSGDHTVRVWEISSCKTLVLLEGHSDAVSSVCFSPHDDDKLVSSSQDCSVRIWSRVKQNCIQILQGHTKGVTDVAFSPFPFVTRPLASASLDNTIRIWEVSDLVLKMSWQTKHILQGHTKGVTSLCFSPHDSQVLVSGSLDYTVRLWYWREGRCFSVLASPNWLPVWAICVVPPSTPETVATPDNTPTSDPEQGYVPDPISIVTASADSTLRGWYGVRRHRVIDTKPEQAEAAEHDASVAPEFVPVQSEDNQEEPDAEVSSVDVIEADAPLDAEQRADGVETGTAVEGNEPQGDIRMPDLVPSGVGEFQATFSLHDGMQIDLDHVMAEMGKTKSFPINETESFLVTSFTDQDAHGFPLDGHMIANVLTRNSPVPILIRLNVAGHLTISRVQPLVEHKMPEAHVALKLLQHICTLIPTAVVLTPCNTPRDGTLTPTNPLAYQEVQFVCEMELGGHTDSVTSVSLCPQDPDLVVSGSKDQTVRVWRRSSQACVAMLQGHLPTLSAIQFGTGLPRPSPPGSDEGQFVSHKLSACCALRTQR